MFMKNYKQTGFEKPLNIKGTNTFIQWKHGSVDVWFTHMFKHQKQHAQSGRGTQSALDIFNTFRIFTHKPIREQEN